MRRLILGALLALVLAAAVAAGAGAAPGGRGNPPQFPQLSGAWTHVSINVTIKKEPHTLLLDRGLVLRATRFRLILREGDGTVVVIPLFRQALVVIDGFPSSTLALARGMTAQTLRVDGGPAVRVRATS